MLPTPTLRPRPRREGCVCVVGLSHHPGAARRSRSLMVDATNSYLTLNLVHSEVLKDLL